MKNSAKGEITSFNFPEGKVLSRKYEVISCLGSGWEGEVYLVREIATGIERTAKFFYPQRNRGDKNIKFYAKKLHKLRHCPIVIQYSAQDTIIFKGTNVSFLLSEYVEGELLSDFILRQPGKRLSPFQAVHLLYNLAVGIEAIHMMGEYHGDLHPENVIVMRYGLNFEMKLLDMFHWGRPTPAHVKHDTVDMVKIFHEALGGQKYYARQPPEVKAICRGLKPSLILKNFKSAGELRSYLENMHWS